MKDSGEDVQRADAGPHVGKTGCTGSICSVKGPTLASASLKDVSV